MITVQFNEAEQAVFNELRERSGLSAEGQIRQMLRWYQLIDDALRNGWTITRTKKDGPYNTHTMPLSGLAFERAPARRMNVVEICALCKGTMGHHEDCKYATPENTIIGPPSA